MAMYTPSASYPLDRVYHSGAPSFAPAHPPHPSASWVNGNGELTSSETQHQHPSGAGPWPSHVDTANHQHQHASYTHHAHDASYGQYHAQHTQQHQAQTQAQPQEPYHAYPQNIANTHSSSPIDQTQSSVYTHPHPQQHYYVLHEQCGVVPTSQRYEAPSGWSYSPSSAQGPTYGRRPGSGPVVYAPQQDQYPVKVEVTETSIPTNYSLWSSSPQTAQPAEQEGYHPPPAQAPVVNQYQPVSVPGFFDGDEPVGQSQYYPSHEHEYTAQPTSDQQRYDESSAYESYSSQPTTYSESPVNHYHVQYPQYDHSRQSDRYTEPTPYESTPVHRPPPLNVSPTSSFSQPWSPVTPVYSSSSLAGALTEVPRKPRPSASEPAIGSIPVSQAPSSATTSPESTRSTTSSSSSARTLASVSPSKSTPSAPPLTSRPIPRPQPSRTSSSLLSISSDSGTLPVHGPAPPGTSKKPLHRSLACLECRSRKVACSLPSAKVKVKKRIVKAEGPSEGEMPEKGHEAEEKEEDGEEKVGGDAEGAEGDFTCRQCLRRGRVCVYPAENMRGRHKVEAKQARLQKEKEEKESFSGCKTEEMECALEEESR